MTISIIELLEVVDIHDRNGVGVFEVEQRVIESAAGGKGGEFVMVGKNVGVLDDGTDQDQSCGRDVRGGGGTDAPGPKGKKRCHDGPQHAAFGRFAMEQETQQQNGDSGGEGKQRQAWHSCRKGARKTVVEKRRGGSFSGATDDGDKNRLEK